MGKRKDFAKTVKRTVKYLLVAPDTSIVKSILQRAPDNVFRVISNAALYARSGEVNVPPHLKSVFRRHNHYFDYLTDKKKPLKHKRRLLIQQGGALPIIVPFSLRYLAPQAVSLFPGYYARMSSFSKKVMIDAAELDRMQQSQIRNYSPELYSIAQRHNQIIDII